MSEQLNEKSGVAASRPPQTAMNTSTVNVPATNALVAVPALRVGQGTDVHAFGGPERELWVAGLHWPGQAGLEGHSDADAVAHAICDAVLAAAGCGDLGSNFGTSAPQWADAPGVTLIRESVRRARAAGWEPVNVSVQMVGNRPKIGPRRAEAEQVLSDALGAPVMLSATTTDGLGFTGRGEGIAALAVAMLAAR